MGKGVHATTALFDQIGHIAAGQPFSGVPEAESLGTTLVEALRSFGIEGHVIDMKEDFRSVGQDGSFKVVIKKEIRSTNTGENVAAVQAAWSESSPNTNYFVIAATTANGRQVRTFAHQLKLPYGHMIGLPMMRNPEFVDRMDQFELATEALAGLAERCRGIHYMLLNYIPLTPIDRENLEGIYLAYAKMSSQNLSDAQAKPISDVLKFFQDKFGALEAVIGENTDPGAAHREKTFAKVQQIVARCLYVAESAANNVFDKFARAYQPHAVATS
jgi:hypothetical protein